MNTKNISTYPLTWPEGWPRETRHSSSRFGKGTKEITIAKATQEVLLELRRMGIRSDDVIISSDLNLRLDGLPYSNQKIPKDVGVSVWWKDVDNQKVIALDKYDKIADNLHAIAKTIEAMRGIRRWGSGEILDRVFSGFTSLPSPENLVSSWRDVFDYYGDSVSEVTNIYRKLRSKHHPDNGGDKDTFDTINKAWEMFNIEIKGSK